MDLLDKAEGLVVSHVSKAACFCSADKTGIYFFIPLKSMAWFYFVRSCWVGTTMKVPRWGRPHHKINIYQ